MASPNQHPEQKDRDTIDEWLEQAGWEVQDRETLNLGSNGEKKGVAIRNYPTDSGPADYVLFVDRKPVGVIEAKPKEWGHKITTVEEQSNRYADSSLKWVNNAPLCFVYESNGVIIRFTDRNDPKPRSRKIFCFQRPETLREWISKPPSLTARLQTLPPLNSEGLRACQIEAIENLEFSFKEDKPRALIQMNMGAGKTYMAITSIYRLLKHAGAKRILFLVDTRNLGMQAEQEFMSYRPVDDNRKFVELYNVQRLSSSYVPPDSQVYISTIQRLYSILKGEELNQDEEKINPAEYSEINKPPVEVIYNPDVPPEFFDFIVIDECHRSIYNVWRQVVEYFDAYLIGLTATPDNRTYSFFNKNVVSEYSHERAIADGVNVGYEIYVIETERTKAGGILKAGDYIEKRERLTRKQRWEQQQEDQSYSPQDLDRDVVNLDQIRTVIRTFREHLPTIFPDRKEVPKTLVYAKTDSHADDIIQIVREEFGESNHFCKKITYRSEENSDSILAQFRNDYNPRIAVTVDMIATGTDVKPLECLLYMRLVKSMNYYQQMNGRGMRTLEHDELKKVTPSAKYAKTHFVIVDAVGVTKSLKATARPLITKRAISVKDLAWKVMMGSRDINIIRSLAGRLSRLNKQLDEKDQKKIIEKSSGLTLTDISGKLLSSIDSNYIEKEARKIAGLGYEEEPSKNNLRQTQEKLIDEAAVVFTGELIELLDTIRHTKEQSIDHENLDSLLHAGWAGDNKQNAEALVQDFEEYLEANKDEMEALTIFYSQPFRRREITFDMMRQVMGKLSTQPKLAPSMVWKAYVHLDQADAAKSERANSTNEFTILMSLIRRACGIDKTVSLYSETVQRNFERWIRERHRGNGEQFNEEQMKWLQMIRDHIITSFHMERNDLEIAPFDAKGGMGKMYQLFGNKMDQLIDQLNEALTV